MCGICSKLGLDPSIQHDLENRSDFSLDPFAGGTYRRTASSPVKSIFTLDQVKNQIDSGQTLKTSSGVITFTFLDKNHLTGLYNNPNLGFTAGLGLSPFSEAQRAAARDSIQLWDDLIPLEFRESKGLGADIQFSNSADPAQAYAYYPQKQGWKFQSDVFVADPELNFTNAWFTPGGYGDTTLIHEIGHAVGLSHPGSYNGAAATTYDGMAEYAQDSMQYSIMSYWSGQNTGALTVNWSLLLNNYAQTPMLHDILTIQAKYGVDTTTRATNTVYGFNSTADRSVFDFADNPYPYLAIYDGGGNDTIDLSGYNAGQFINLHAGSFSSVGQTVATAAQINANTLEFNATTGANFGPVTQAQVDATAASFVGAATARIAGFTGVAGIAATSHDNLSIAYGVTIENAIGGSARDLLWGNEVDNVLKGMGGNDVLNGYEGADTLWGGTGNDTFQFSHLEQGDRVADFHSGDLLDVSKLDANAGLPGNQAFSFIGGAAFTVGTAGQLRYANGTVEADVNGDGIADFAVIVVGNPALIATDFLL